jgi:hypothetical protein
MNSNKTRKKDLETTEREPFNKVHYISMGGYDDTQEDKTNEGASKTSLDPQQQAVTTEHCKVHSDDTKTNGPPNRYSWRNLNTRK